MTETTKPTWCSWCFRKTHHELVQQNYLRRNVFQCRDCLNRTIYCRICKAMARGYEDYDDELCAKHDGLLGDWGQKPPSKAGWCSWCMEKTEHKPLERNLTPGRRDVSECERCGRRTVPCRSCDDAMARGHATWDDRYCAKCDGTICGWYSHEEKQRALRRTGWCSWCFEYAEHLLEQKNTVRRDVYACDSCLGRTLPCRKCDSGMVRGGPGWDDELCEAHGVALTNWAEGKKRRDKLVNRPWGPEEIKSELSRHSSARQDALQSGMIRPFLLLVSMDPIMRAQVAAQLGWSIYTKDYAGDPHREAWDIISANGKGIQARTNASYETLNPLAANCNWYETLFRTAKEVFKKVDPEKQSYGDSIDACRSSTDATLPRFEEWYVGKLSQLQAKHMTQAQVAELDELMNSDEVRDLARAMKSAGIASGSAIRYGVNIVSNAIRAGGFNTYILSVKVAAAMNRNLGTKIVMSHAAKAMSRLASAVNVVGWVWLAADVLNLIFGSSHGRLFPPVAQILNQRLFLAAEGIRIEDYY